MTEWDLKEKEIELPPIPHKLKEPEGLIKFLKPYEINVSNVEESLNNNYRTYNLTGDIRISKNPPKKEGDTLPNVWNTRTYVWEVSFDNADITKPWEIVEALEGQLELLAIGIDRQAASKMLCHVLEPYVERTMYYTIENPFYRLNFSYNYKDKLLEHGFIDKDFNLTDGE